MKYKAFIPVKSLTSAKSRLALSYTPEDRQRLVVHMLMHVLHVLHQTNLFTHIFVVSEDKTLIQAITKEKAYFLYIQMHNQNDDLLQAIKKAGVTFDEKVLAISSDLPLVKKEDIINFVTLYESSDVVLSPSKEGTGTNAIVSRPLILPYYFGTNSLEKFVKNAQSKNLKVSVYENKSIAFDVDTPEDITILTKKYTFLKSFSSACNP